MNIIFETSTHKAETSGTVYKPTQSDIEREWRDSELLRTDELIKLPDYPIDLTGYRAELRAYPEQADFPNGVRPTL